MAGLDDLPPPPVNDLPPVPPLPPGGPNANGPTDDYRTRSYFSSPPETVTGFPFAGPIDSHWPEIPGFVIIGELGSGGMGIVYKARQLRLNRTVALKMIRRDLAQNAHWTGIRERFTEEAQSLARLQHPNIVQIHDTAEHAGQPYLVMEFVAGGGLDSRLKGELPPPTVAAEMVRTLARAVQVAHDQKIVHRDLKPSNVLVAPDGTLKIADFGLATLLDDASAGSTRQSVVGTPGYMAPEQARGECISPLMDVYALGAILYKLLVNHAPFTASTATASNRMIVELPPVPPRQQQPHVPRNLEAICLKCLEEVPARRYASATALADDLDRHLRGEPTIARPVGQGRRLAMWTRRRPATAGFLVTGILLLIASVAFAGVAVRNAVLDLDKRRIVAEKQVADSEAEVSGFAAHINEAEQRAAPGQVVNNPGWLPRALNELRIAAASRLAASQAERLRNVLASTESRIDLEVVGTVADNVNPHCLTVSADGKKVAIGDIHGAIGADVRLYFDNKKYRQTITDGVGTGSNGIRALAFSPDGRWLVAGSRGGKLVVWDTNAPDQPARNFKHDQKESLNGLGFVSDGTKFVAVWADKTIAAWDPATGERIAIGKYPGEGERPLSVHFFDDRFLIGMMRGAINYRSADLRPGEPVRSSGEDIRIDHPCQHIRSTPNGELLAVAGGSDLRLYAVHTDYPIGDWLRDGQSEHAHSAEITGLSIDPTGTLLASGGADNLLKLWDLTTGAILLRLFLPGEEGVIPAFDPSTGDLLVAASAKVMRYRIVRPKTVRLMGSQKGPNQRVAFVGDGNTIATAIWQLLPWNQKFSIGDLAVWDATDGHRIANHAFAKIRGAPEIRSSLTVHPTTKVLVIGGMPETDLVEWNWEQKTAPRTITIGKPRVRMTSLLQLSQDGTRLWGTAPDGVTVREVTWPEQQDLLAKSDGIRNVIAKRSRITDIAVGRSWAIVGALDYTIKLISTANPTDRWETVSAGEGVPIQCVALSPEESLVLAGTWSGKIVAFGLPGREPVEIPLRHADRVEAMAFAPDGKLVATGGRDNTIRLWERNGEQFRSLVTYPTAGPVIDLKFSPDGKRLAFVIENQRAFNVWDLAKFRQNLASMGLDW